MSSKDRTTDSLHDPAEDASLSRDGQQIREEIGMLISNHKTALSEDDLEYVENAQILLQSYPIIGHFLGFGLGLLGAHRLRTKRTIMLQAFVKPERAIRLVYASGRVGKDPQWLLTSQYGQELVIDFDNAKQRLSQTGSFNVPGWVILLHIFYSR